MKPSFCRRKYFDLLAAGFISSAVALIVSASDRVITGFFFGIEGLSALAIVDPLSSIIGFLSVIFIFGLRFVYPTEVGKKNQERANQFFSCALTMALIISFIFLIVITSIGDAYFTFQNISSDYLTYAQDYFFFAKYVFILQPITGLLGATIFTDGNARIIRVSNLFYVIANILLSIVFAYFFGMYGIGLGTLVAGLGSFGLQCTHFFSDKCSIKYRPYLALHDMLEIARYGIAEASYTIFSGINGVIINWLIINYLGAQYLAIHSVVGYGMCLCAFFGGCQASMVPLLNVYLGENNWDGMKKILRTTLMSSFIIGLILTAIAFVIAPLIPVMFSITTPELAEVCTVGTRVSCLTFAITGILGVITRYYNAIGKNVLATVLTILKDSVIFLILFAICITTSGVMGMWLCNLLNPIVALPLFFLIMRIALGKNNMLCLPNLETEIKSWDFVLSLDEIVKVRDEVGAYFSEQGASKKATNRAMFLVEEHCMMIVDNNPQKSIIAEITVMGAQDGFHVIFRDSGILEDLADEDHDTSSFRACALSGLTSLVDIKDYMKIGGYNRKEYRIESM